MTDLEILESTPATTPANARGLGVKVSAEASAAGIAARVPSGEDGRAGVGTPAAPEPAADAVPAAGAAVDGQAEAAGQPPQPTEIEYPDPDPEEDPAGEPTATDASAVSPATARYGTAALTRLFKDNPELAQAVEASKQVKSQLYQMARRSQELAQYQELVPSLSRAKTAVEAQAMLSDMDGKYFGQAPDQFWQGLHAASGTSGAYERNVQFLHRVFLDQLEQSPELHTAVAAIRETLGWGNNRTARSQASDAAAPASRPDNTLPAHIRQQLDELQQLRSRRSQQEQQAQQHFMDDTAQEAGREVRAFVDGILAQTGYSDYDKHNITRDFLEEVARLADQDKVHAAALEELLRSGGTTPATRSRMVSRIKSWARQNGRDILEPILQRAGAGLKQRQAQREAMRAQQRSEPAAAGVAASPTQVSARDLVRQAEGRLKRRLSDREILDLA